MNDVPSTLVAGKPLIEPQKLQHFLLVYELGNFARAADSINVTQQAVSKSIARLEEQLGVKLFERGAYGAQATPYGEALAKRAQIIVMENRLATAEISAMKGATDGFVRIGVGWSFLPRIAPQLISRFRRRRPGVTLSLVSGDTRSLFDKLQRGEVELVASAPPLGFKIDDSLEAEQLFEDRDIIVMRADHPLAGKATISLEDLAQQTWLVSLALHEQWRFITNVFVAAGVSPPANIVDMDSITLAKSVIAQSDSVSLLASELVAHEIERGEFHGHVHPDFPTYRPAYCTIRKGSALQPAASALKKDISYISRQFRAKAGRAKS